MRKINELKENECIHIRTKKEAKGIAELLSKTLNEEYTCNRGDKITIMHMTVFLATEDQNIALPASEFLPPKKDKLRKKVLKAFPELINLIEVKTELSELQELPNKWRIKVTPENGDILTDWKIKISNNKFNIHASLFQYVNNDGGGGMGLSESYTEISTEDFKRLVLKEDVKDVNPKPIDWSKPGQLVVNNMGVVWMITGKHKTDTFGAMLVKDKLGNTGICTPDLHKHYFKLYTGEPITLSNDNN